MSDNKYGLEDLVAAAVEQRPTEFQSVFNDILVDRLQSAVQEKKIEIAQSIYGSNKNFENNVED